MQAKNIKREVKRLGIADVLFHSKMRRMEIQSEKEHRDGSGKNIGLSNTLLHAVLLAENVSIGK